MSSSVGQEPHSPLQKVWKPERELNSILNMVYLFAVNFNWFL